MKLRAFARKHCTTSLNNAHDDSTHIASFPDRDGGHNKDDDEYAGDAGQLRELALQP